MLRITELGMPVELYTVMIKFNPYAGAPDMIITCSSLERAEWVCEQAWHKYDNIESVSVPIYHWLDEFEESEEMWQ